MLRFLGALLDEVAGLFEAVWWFAGQLVFLAFLGFLVYLLVYLVKGLLH